MVTVSKFEGLSKDKRYDEFKSNYELNKQLVESAVKMEKLADEINLLESCDTTEGEVKNQSETKNIER